MLRPLTLVSINNAGMYGMQIKQCPNGVKVVKIRGNHFTILTLVEVKTEVCTRRFIALSTVEQACSGACYLGQCIAEIKIEPYGEKVDFEIKSF